MSLINKKLIDFKVEAYQNGEFKTVETKNVLGKWSVFFFYPADFTFVCPTELADLGTVYIKLGQMLLLLLKILNIQCLETQQAF